MAGVSNSNGGAMTDPPAAWTFVAWGGIPGRAATLTARLKRGVRYSFWCGVSDHAEDGMRGSFVAR